MAAATAAFTLGDNFLFSRWKATETHYNPIYYLNDQRAFTQTSYNYGKVKMPASLRSDRGHFQSERVGNFTGICVPKEVHMKT
jgi:hypothetical protein